LKEPLVRASQELSDARVSRAELLRRGAALGASLSAVGALAPAALARPSAAPFTVAFLYPGPVGDVGWSWTHDQGRKAVQRALGVKTIKVENVVTDADVRRALTNVLDQGVSLVFACSIGMQKVATQIAGTGDTPIMIASAIGYGGAIGGYAGSAYEAFYACGYVSGKMTRSNEIGWVASFPFPEWLRDVNAFALGARAANPSAKVTVVWTNSFFDPKKEAEAASALIDQGADGVGQEVDSPAVQQEAQRRRVYAISSNSPMGRFAPRANLTGQLYTWDPYYIAVVNRVRAGTWQAGYDYLGMKQGVIRLAPYGQAVPARVRAETNALVARIKSGRLKPFRGPIADQRGRVRIRAGQVWEAGDTGKFDFLVDNISGKAS
jgi:basic membrane protein A